MKKDEFEEKSKGWDSNPLIVAMSKVFSGEIRKQVKLDKDQRWLELGCGTGLVGLSLATDVRSIVMVDKSVSMLSILREKVSVFDFRNVEIVEGEMVQAALDDASIDVIVSFMAFHHIDDIPAVLKEFKRILKKEGIVIVGDLCREDGSFHGPTLVPHNGFDPDEIRGLFETNGFGVSKQYVFNTVERPDPGGTLRRYDQFVLVAVRD
jgi:ubiquinone/menaquinone biosynthesis C-methylase UbiE